MKLNLKIRRNSSNYELGTAAGITGWWRAQEMLMVALCKKCKLEDNNPKIIGNVMKTKIIDS